MSIKFTDAVRQALWDEMKHDPSVLVIGEGVPDPKGIFGTTLGLQEHFGKSRVFDMPLSENGMTGACLGLALRGYRPVLIHQRIDFSLLAMDQMVNHIAKWRYMFAGQQHVPLVIRMIIGKGWGQGPQHSQALWGMLAQVPGLKVVLPASAAEAYAMLRLGIRDSDPVIFVEHRWQHHTLSNKSSLENWHQRDLKQASIVHSGDDVTLCGWGYSVLECHNAAHALEKVGIRSEVVNLRIGHRLDTDLLLESINKTKNLVVHDLHPEQLTPAHSVVSKLFQLLGDEQRKKVKMRVVAQPNHPVPTSWHLAQHSYAEAPQIIEAALALLGRLDLLTTALSFLSRPSRPDAPNQDFCGPF